MKILFISDIHGITTNLKVIEKKIKTEKIDLLVCLGDLYSYGFLYTIDNDNNEVLKFLSKYKDILICMRGNCDYSLVNTDFHIYDELKGISTDGISIYMTHGNKYSLKNGTVFDKNSLLVYGHEHIPYIKKEHDMTYINVGSISLPRGGSKPTYGIYDNKKFTIYDVEDNIVSEVDLD